MSSGFVSGGTADAPIERSDEWIAAQKEIEANRQRKSDQARQQDGRSLFETLEANKAAKQEAFEEANRLKNQFRALDEDEIEFLDSVLESTRAEEDRVKRETAEGLALFRKQQEEADKKVRGGSDTAEEAGSPVLEGESSWTAAGRKRKRAKDKEVLKGVKLRRSSTTSESGKPAQTSPPAASPPARPESRPELKQETARVDVKSPVPVEKPPTAAKGSLVAYGSDDDDW